ncbi:MULTISPECIES: monovalent cation/H(+) antiporter subunit G [unclassified Saccharicrinis]|uniref:monovalent cation/H(+) antiporter subunit G n=1 Tax=unclassified Saccharicrinis TaxID=2646859 RepID=UPI003D346DAB
MNQIFISVLIVLGALWILIAAIGLIRFKDVYSRIHATTKATSLGIMLIVAGVVFYFRLWDVTLKSILIIVFVYLTSPLAAHSIAKSSKDDTDTKKNL